MKREIGTELLPLLGAALLAASSFGETPASCEAWLAGKGAELIRGAERKMADGTVVYAPQAGDWYKATWLRDYVMMLEGELVPTQRMAGAAQVFLRAVSPAGDSCDCVAFDGTVMRRPGYDTCGENPVLDGYPYLVSLVYETWRQTGDARWLASDVLATLEKVLARMPRRDGLPWIDPAKDYDRAPWGFTDSTRKTGNVLFCTLLEIRARRELAELLAAAGRPAAGQRQRERAEDLAAKANDAFWDPHAGLYYAATARCRQHDVWGSAYAVWLGVADGPRADAVATAFRRDYAGLVQNGQVRHLRPGEQWEAYNAHGKPGQYQNGHFWGTPVGWFGYALARVDPALAEKTFSDLTADYRRRGPNERTLGERQFCADYLASVALPLQGLRRLRREREGASLAFDNPVWKKDAPDPTVWRAGKVWYAASTHQDILVSEDRVHWRETGRRLLEKAEYDWIAQRWPHVWAPDVVRIGDWYMLYETFHNGGDHTAIASYRSKSPTGPFTDRSILLTSEEVRQREIIDPDVVTDGGRTWLFFGHGDLRRVELEADGRSVRKGAKIEHVAGIPWEGRDKNRYFSPACSTEGAYLHWRRGWWYLFVSQGSWMDHTYCVGVGRSTTLDGAFFTRDGEPMAAGKATVILSTDVPGEFFGPGHNGEIVTSPTGRDYIFYHCHWRGNTKVADDSNVRIGSTYVPRPLFLQEIFWDADGWPYFGNGGKPQKDCEFK